ncbi:hypothetical protein EIKCOROL_01826 [Eikenella corrodens ATCC 23834]|uniref:Uncharacterized protein n=1 Tax=Eikenella corrodens ATCC 23834 TaxID=546274 RepID=C0DWS4_EIKCO|nr:hypothetical protein EIKCOROL_01826 [Eikenella corrodens ATCC 23834]
MWAWGLTVLMVSELNGIGVFGMWQGMAARRRRWEKQPALCEFEVQAAFWFSGSLY